MNSLLTGKFPLATVLLLIVIMFSCTHENEAAEDKKQDPNVAEWEDSVINGDATMGAPMLFSVGDSINVVREEGKTRTTTTIAGGTTFSLNDLVTIGISGSLRGASELTKSYKVTNTTTGALAYNGTATDAFFWKSTGEVISLRAWSYGDGTTTSADPDNSVYSLETNQAANGYKELLYSPAQSCNYADDNGGINIQMYHQMARVVVTLSRKATDAATVSSITIGDGTVTIPTSAKFHKPTSGNTGAWDNITKTAVTVSMKQETENTVYSAVLIPDTYASNTNFVKVTMNDGNVYTYTTDAAMTLSAGYQYNFSISIGNDVATLEAVYPSEWTASGYPVTSYNSGETFGVYVRKSDGTMLYSNIPMAAASGGSTVSLNTGSYSRLLSTSYTYFIYYPYKASQGMVTTTANTAADFFAGVISSWTTAASQGTTDALRANDLQVAMITGDGAKTHTLTATMAHKAGLAVMTLGTKNVPTVQYFNASNTILSGNTDGTTTSVTASSTFSTNIPCLSSSKYYAVLNGSRTFTGTGTDGWTYSPNASGGSVVTNTIYSKRTFIKKGWVYNYTGGMQSLTITQAGSYKLEVWGAQGGHSNGGKGGNSYGNKSLSNGNILYVCVGGQGEAVYTDDGGTFSRAGAGGYNGGGAGGAGYSTCSGGSGGGGATHIAITTSGTLYTVLNNASTKNNVLIAAGGGGGGNTWFYDKLPNAIPEEAAARNCRGGSGGGTTGGASDGYTYTAGNPVMSISQGCSSNSYYALGKGQDGIEKTSGSCGGEGNGGGGGGYYGGFSNQSTGMNSNALGGGGAGYIGGVTGGSTTNGVREGNGYARITTNFEWTF